MRGVSVDTGDSLVGVVVGTAGTASGISVGNKVPAAAVVATAVAAEAVVAAVVAAAVVRAVVVAAAVVEAAVVLAATVEAPSRSTLSGEKTPSTPYAPMEVNVPAEKSESRDAAIPGSDKNSTSTITDPG